MPKTLYRDYTIKDGEQSTVVSVEVIPHFTRITSELAAPAVALDGRVRREIQHWAIADPHSDLDGTSLGFVVRELWDDRSGNGTVERSRLVGRWASLEQAKANLVGQESADRDDE